MSLLTEMSMPNFNEMNMLNTALCVFSALVTLFLLIGAVTDINSRKPFMKSFIVLALIYLDKSTMILVHIIKHYL